MAARTGKNAKPRSTWLRLSNEKGLVYRKEAIYQGDWGKLSPSGDGIEFSVYRDTLQHWRNSVDELRRNGVSIPISRSHDNWESTKDRLGEVVKAAVGKNSKGKLSLFLDIKFDNVKLRNEALKGDVSIGSPPLWYDGAKNKYHYPLQHVASTAAPVIPGLETWQAIAAAFNAAKSSNGVKMDLDELIAMLGIEVDESVNTDEAKKALIQAKLKELVGAGSGSMDGGGQGDAPVDASQKSGAGATPTPTPTPGVPQAKKVTVAFSHGNGQAKPAPLQIKTIRKGRQAELDSYVAQGSMSPAVAKELAMAHCTDDGISLELSNGSDGASFDSAVKIAILASKGRTLSKSGRTEAGDASDDAVIELSHSKGSEHSLVKDAERRAELAKSGR